MDLLCRTYHVGFLSISMCGDATQIEQQMGLGIRYHREMAYGYKNSVNFHSAHPLLRSWEYLLSKQTEFMLTLGLYCTHKVYLRLLKPLHTTGQQYTTQSIFSVMFLT